MIANYHKVSNHCSMITTRTYSTSFSSAIQLLHRDLRKPIYNIYGFVRFADEIVDTFHDYDKAALLSEFKLDTYRALERGISHHPILHSFQETVRQYQIPLHLIESFFKSMEMDLEKRHYDDEMLAAYIYGSAEVVGLMCLCVFCEGDRLAYDRLLKPAQALGAAFQKVNFLRDIRSDITFLSRVYFPGCDFSNFTEDSKQRIVDDINADFREAYHGIMQLPVKARFGVYVAYKYYLSLFRRIKQLEPKNVLEKRIRIPNYRKLMIVLRAGVKNQMGLI